MRFLRTIRLDSSDESVFPTAARSGEWAVSGAFAFADADPAVLAGKERQAFTNGFLGTESFGWSTLAIVSEIERADYEAVVVALAGHFVARYGAPDLAAALPAARAEADFAASLCEHKVNTLIAVERSFGDSGIVERFRAIKPPREPAHARIWQIVEAEDA
ncbi:DUF6505 family protein [Rhodospirillaceae bacterium SYSU D60014]|uniref:DUF6505 family protein n=1 Tax=Virgifigura deserti TaxID=2268457 RepID=UPI000E660828